MYGKRKRGVRNKLSRDVMDALRAQSEPLTRALIDAAALDQPCHADVLLEIANRED